ADSLANAVAAADRFIAFNSQGIDTIDLQTAVEIFKADPQPKTIFKLPRKPAKSDIELLRALDFETLLYRERMTDNWYIVRGEQYTVGGERYKVIRALGDMDVTIHNHPTAVQI
ncbi:hypothetical protein RZS08_46655, partial [Arthrospira platensis SPKY1]|nr:hypothetical protein [Arthrospira platensis SPKY1]